MRISHHARIEVGAAAAVRTHCEQDGVDSRVVEHRVRDLGHDRGGTVPLHRGPCVDRVVDAAGERVHRGEAGPSGGCESRHLDTEFLRMVGGDDPGAPGRADRRHPPRRSRRSHQCAGTGEIDEIDELAGRYDAGLGEQSAGDPAGDREVRGMRSARLRARLGTSDQSGHHRLAARDGPGRAQEPGTIRESFEVQRNHRRGGILREVLEDIGRADVAGVAEGGNRAHAESGPLHELIEKTGHVDTALGDDTDAALANVRQVDERCEQAVRGIDKAAAVRPPHRHPRLAGTLHDAGLECLALPARLCESGRRHQHGGHAACNACFEDGEHVTGRPEDDREIDCRLDRVERGMAPIAGDPVRVRVDRKHRPRVVAAEIVHLVEAGLARRSRRPDDSDAARLEEAARGVVASRGHRN